MNYNSPDMEDNEVEKAKISTKVEEPQIFEEEGEEGQEIDKEKVALLTALQKYFGIEETSNLSHVDNSDLKNIIHTFEKVNGERNELRISYEKIKSLGGEVPDWARKILDTRVRVSKKVLMTNKERVISKILADPNVSVEELSENFSLRKDTCKEIKDNVLSLLGIMLGYGILPDKLIYLLLDSIWNNS